ncbi:hypothetical protein ACFQ0M_49135 [Kitasatospora aburaviensis]
MVRVSDGTSGDIGDRLGGLETKFDVGDGDVILQPNRKRTAEAVLRVVTGDLFGAMKPPPYRAPHSVDITDAGVFGMSADGTDLEFSLAELMGEVIARSGGGKSTIIRDLLDWTTAAHNAVTVFLDPSGDGPGKFTDAVKLTSTSPIQIEFALLSLYRLAAGRARIRRKLGMGDTWRCTREHPAIILFVDEFPKLTKRSKQIIAELQLVGRKEGVWLIFAAQGATKELLGSNIAQQPALKIMGACRDVDTTQALGGGAIDWGFLPHRLQPKSGDSLNDCAKSYVIGAPGVSEDPMLHKWHYIPDDEEAGAPPSGSPPAWSTSTRRRSTRPSRPPTRPVSSSPTRTSTSTTFRGRSCWRCAPRKTTSSAPTAPPTKGRNCRFPRSSRCSFTR